MSLIAVFVSGFTTFLTFFDERYTLTAAIANVGSGTQQSAGYSDDVGLNVTYQNYVKPTFILSNRGTRSLVLTDVNLVRSSKLDACEASTDVVSPIDADSLGTIILDPDSVQSLTREYRISRITVHYDRKPAPASAADSLNAEHEPQTWCLQLIVFDHRGRRMEPLLEAMTMEPTFEPMGPEDDYPTGTMAIEHPIAANQLLSRGALF
ncbi:MAG: hypothetical protein E4H03_04180 [Myxococcales bacterium]|nr:MAG: hypothetical protein E4H03_04180 [Myxococcales bacterium]